jgi:glycine dehydrogenase subunit 2
MIEPTETESLEELERYAQILERISIEDPDVVTHAPHTTPVGRLDEAMAAKKQALNWNQLDRIDQDDEA